jgi:hypothetical protein
LAKKKREEKPREYTRRQLSHFQRQKRRQRIILFSGIAVILAIAIIVSVGWYLGDFKPLHRTIIQINDAKFNVLYYVDALEMMYNMNSNQTPDSLSSNLANYIIQDELIRQGAGEVGITVSDDDVRNLLGDTGKSADKATLDFFRTNQLESRLKDEYFNNQVPVSDNMVHMMAMMVESESVGWEVHDKLANGDNFTELNDQYALNDYSKNTNQGDYGWHPRDILQTQTKSFIPIDWALGAQVGDISPPLTDNESTKQYGYWLINVTARSQEGEAQVQALLLSSRDQAMDIKARLESGDDLSTLADTYSQYSPSQQGHGDLGLIPPPESENATSVSKAFDQYTFDNTTMLNQWSDPIPDDAFTTKGGYWIVKVAEKEDNRPLSDEDRSSLINTAYSNWVSQLWMQYATVIDTRGMTEAVRKQAVDRATKELRANQR